MKIIRLFRHKISVLLTLFLLFVPASYCIQQDNFLPPLGTQSLTEPSSEILFFQTAKANEQQVNDNFLINLTAPKPNGFIETFKDFFNLVLVMTMLGIIGFILLIVFYLILALPTGNLFNNNNNIAFLAIIIDVLALYFLKVFKVIFKYFKKIYKKNRNSILLFIIFTLVLAIYIFSYHRNYDLNVAAQVVGISLLVIALISYIIDIISKISHKTKKRKEEPVVNHNT